MAYDRVQAGYEVATVGRRRVDYRLEVGHAEVPVGQQRGFAILDAARSAALRAWTSSLIPARGERPSAGDVGAAEYIDATAFAAPRIRGLLLEALQAVERLAGEREGKPFAECPPEARTAILRSLELEDHAGFGMIHDLTYEAYYCHPAVLEVLERETGWRSANSTEGGQMEPFDQGLLARVRTLPPTYKRV